MKYEDPTTTPEKSVLELEAPKTPDGYLEGAVALESCQNCGMLAPVYQRKHDRDYFETVCGCGTVTGHEAEGD